MEDEDRCLQALRQDMILFESSSSRGEELSDEALRVIESASDGQLRSALKLFTLQLLRYTVLTPNLSTACLPHSRYSALTSF